MGPSAISIGVLYCLLSFLGITGNLWVLSLLCFQIWPYLRKIASRNGQPLNPGKNWNPTFTHLTVLSFSDLASASSLPFTVVDLVKRGWIFGHTLCRVHFLMEGMHKFLSPFVLVSIAVERYLAVCQPAKVLVGQNRRVCASLAVCLLLAFAFLCPLVLYVRLVTIHGHNVTKCALHLPPDLWDTLYLVQLVATYVIPSLMIMSLYGCIICRLRQHRNRIQSSLPFKRIFAGSLAVLGFYFISWTPYWVGWIYVLTRDSLPPQGFNSTDTLTVSQVNQVSLVMYVLHAGPYLQPALNWIFYAYFNSQLRKLPPQIPEYPGTAGNCDCTPTPLTLMSRLRARSRACSFQVEQFKFKQPIHQARNRACSFQVEQFRLEQPIHQKKGLDDGAQKQGINRDFLAPDTYVHKNMK